MKARTLWVAAATAVIGAALQWFYMNRFEERVSGGVPLGVVVAAHDLKVGDPITASMLGVRQIPSAYVDLRHIGAKDTDVLIGETLAVAIRTGESLLWSDLQLDPTRDADLADRIRPGMRAVTLNTLRDAGLADLLRPGDRVDILLSSSSAEATRVEGWTRILLQNVLVLAVGSDLGAQGQVTQRSGRSERRVTVSVSPEESQRLAQAEHHGRLTLTLRHPDDAAAIDNVQRVTSRDVLALPAPPSLVFQPRAQQKEIERVD